MSRDSPPGASLAALTEREDAEAALKRIIALGLLDRDRKVQKRGDWVEIPVLEPVAGCAIVCQQEPAFYRTDPHLALALSGVLSPEEIELLPRGWFILGDVIVVKIHPLLERVQVQIAQALLDFYPRCRTILRDFGIQGQLREPVRKIIAGDSTVTTHRENGVLFRLDASKVMFSQGNLRERMRMSLLGKDELVVDMFAGIGYFSLPMAVHSRPRKVISIELNPVAFGYLCQNILLNHVQEIVQPVLGDCAKKTPQDVADRVVMGFVGITNRYLQKGIEALRPGGILHYHQTVPSRQYPEAAIRDVVAAASAAGRTAVIQKCIRVKKYSPGMVHAVVDARIDENI